MSSATTQLFRSLATALLVTSLVACAVEAPSEEEKGSTTSNVEASKGRGQGAVRTTDAGPNGIDGGGSPESDGGSGWPSGNDAGSPDGDGGAWPTSDGGAWPDNDAGPWQDGDAGAPDDDGDGGIGGGGGG